MHSAIRARQVDAATALRQTLDEYATLYSQISDTYLRERMTDLRDVVSRILTQLAVQQAKPFETLTEAVILVTPEILPSQALTFDRSLIAGILTETGGPTGHAAILARAMGIPAISGLQNLMQEISTGQLIAMDGREGQVFVDPSPEIESAYRKLQREYVDLRGRLSEVRDKDVRSADGVEVELLANVSGAADATMAGCGGASGVGLYRTEYLFLAHPTVPNEEEQYKAYRDVIASSPNQKVTIRTLDLGGDKQVAYFNTQREANPFMGFRSSRISSAYPEFFQTQLRAILRAAVEGQVSLLFPMISTLEEVQHLKKILLKTRVMLQRSGVPHAEKMPVGIMIEVPAAAICIEELFDEVDFISIGTNDLIQYLMAADRDNPRVANLCEPFAPALLRVLNRIIKAADDRCKPVTVCGEMAGRPRCVLALFGMGLRSFSMSPGLVPSVRELLRHVTLPVAQEIAQKVLKMRTANEVRTHLAKRIQEIWPDVALFDTRQ